MGLLLLWLIKFFGRHKADCEGIANLIRRILMERGTTVGVLEKNRGADDTRLVEEEVPVCGHVRGLAFTAIWSQDNFRGNNSSQSQQHLVRQVCIAE